MSGDYLLFYDFLLHFNLSKLALGFDGLNIAEDDKEEDERTKDRDDSPYDKLKQANKYLIDECGLTIIDLLLYDLTRRQASNLVFWHLYIMT